MHIPPIGTGQRVSGDGGDAPDPSQEVVDCLNQCENGLSNELRAWVMAHPKASKQEAETELDTLAKKYETQLNHELDQLRQKNLRVGPVIDSIQPNEFFHTFVDQIRAFVDKKGDMPLKTALESLSSENQIAGQQQKVQDIFDHIKQIKQQFQSQLSAAQTVHQTTQTAYTHAQGLANGCKDPTKKSHALAELAQAKTALESAQKTLPALRTHPNSQALDHQLAAAREALKAFAMADSEQAHAAVAAAQVAGKNAEREIGALNKHISGVAQHIATATSHVRAALNAVSSTASTPVEDYDKLVIDGHTCNEVNGFIFPAGGYGGWGTSEGMGNWMRDALKNGDMKLFQKLLNSYYHVCQQAPDHMGLMPWSIDQNGNALDKGSATDGDEDIISTLIDAVAKNPNLTMTADGKTMKVSDMLKQAIANFAKFDCGSADGLKGGSAWGDKLLGPGFTDYFDPTALAKMINYCKANGMSDQVTPLNNAMQGMLQYVEKELNANGQPSFPANAGDGSVAFVRDLYRLTEFIASPLSAGFPSVKSEVLKIVQQQLTLGFNGGPNGSPPPALEFKPPSVFAQVPGSWQLGGAQVSAPLYFAMKLLSDKGLLPQSLESKLPAVKAALDNDMATQFNNLSSQNLSDYNNSGNYLGLTLGILCESLLKEYSS